MTTYVNTDMNMDEAERFVQAPRPISLLLKLSMDMGPNPKALKVAAANEINRRLTASLKKLGSYNEVA